MYESEFWNIHLSRVCVCVTPEQWVCLRRRRASARGSTAASSRTFSTAPSSARCSVWPATGWVTSSRSAVQCVCVRPHRNAIPCPSQVSVTLENFQDISLPIPGKEDLAKLHSATHQTSLVKAGSCGEAYAPQGWIAFVLEYIKRCLYIIYHILYIHTPFSNHFHLWHVLQHHHRSMTFNILMISLVL